MSNEKVEWMIVTEENNKELELGAVGFHGDKIVAYVAFHEARDFNRDGEVTIGERVRGFIPIFGNKNIVMTSVVVNAYADPNIAIRDPNSYRYYGKSVANLGFSLITEGVYLAYFTRPVSVISGGVAKKITEGMVKQMIVKQGFSSLFKAGYNEALGQ